MASAKGDCSLRAFGQLSRVQQMEPAKSSAQDETSDKASRFDAQDCKSVVHGDSPKWGASLASWTTGTR